MNLRRTILNRVYPLLIKWNKLTGRRHAVQKNEKLVRPSQSIYDLVVELNNGGRTTLGQWKGKKLLLVNTASDCGYTRQYAELQRLYEGNQDRLAIVAFPSNDFRHQEKGSNEEIAQFCKINFGVTFPLAKKSNVIGPARNGIFRWLSQPDLNGWCKQSPTWNFSKYLLDEDGILIYYFDPAVSPLSGEMQHAIFGERTAR